MSKFSDWKKRAGQRGLSWSITQDQHAHVTRDGVCHYCGGDITTAGSSLDRMDNARGYEPDNVVACCQRCNVEKGSTISYEEYVWLWRFRRARESAEAKVLSLHASRARPSKGLASSNEKQAKRPAEWRTLLQERVEKRRCGVPVDAPWPTPPQEGETVAAWRTRLGITQKQASRLLACLGVAGWSYRTVQRSEQTR
jgi:hypothetical protein